MEPSTKAPVFRLTGKLPFAPFPAIARLVEHGLERLFALEDLERMYQELARSRDLDHFLTQVLECFRTDYDVPADDLKNVPTSGPAIVVANHPFGAIEGVMLAHLLRRIRPDVRIIANSMLDRIPELSGLFISVDPFGGKDAARRNLAPLRQAVRWVTQGGLLLVFPAGTVSHLNIARRCVTDSEWSPTIGRLVKITRAPVVPVYVHGSNGMFFQLAGLLHAKLRTALLPRELLNKSRTTVRLQIGQSIPHLHLTAFESDGNLMDYLRFRTYLLADIQRPCETDSIPVLTEPVEHEAVAPAINANLVKAEIEALPAEAKLLESGSFRVYCAGASQIPWCLQEIGRLREQSFRAAGEGTGKATDIDLFDAHYLHLFVWDQQPECIVGAYRLGLTDQILPRHGRRGLYTQSLFRYGRKVLDYLNPAIELGRSFVRPEYQKTMAPLFLLWRGIGEFVVRNPRYALLFGPVSISNDYDPASRSLLVSYLKANCVDPDLSRFVKPRRPFRGARPSVLGRARLSCIKDIDHISRAVSQIEQDSKGVPVLLKQYLKLGGRILGFNSDDQFSDSLDGLIVVDMRRAEPQTLARYLGPEGVEKFLAWHAVANQSSLAVVS